MKGIRSCSYFEVQCRPDFRFPTSNSAFVDAKVDQECLDDTLLVHPKIRKLEAKAEKKNAKMKEVRFSRSMKKKMHTQFGTHQPIVTERAHFKITTIYLVDPDRFIENCSSLGSLVVIMFSVQQLTKGLELAITVPC